MTDTKKSELPDDMQQRFDEGDKFLREYRDRSALALRDEFNGLAFEVGTLRDRVEHAESILRELIVWAQDVDRRNPAQDVEGEDV